MKNKILLGAMLTAACAIGQTLPVQDLSYTGFLGTVQYPAVPLNSAQFKTAATVSVKVDNLGTVSDAERNEFGTNTAVYAGSAKLNNNPPPAGPVENGEVPAGTMYDFKLSTDSAQAWATMHSNGMPYLLTQTFGMASASAAASWNAKLIVPDSGYVYVQFVIPQVKVTGALEGDAPSPINTRFRADLLANGHPIWSTEALRLSKLDGTLEQNQFCKDINKDYKYLALFGKALTFADNHENTSSNKKSVTVAIGPLESGQTLDLNFVARMDAQTLRKCCVDNNQPESPFCSRATGSLAWDSQSDPVKFYKGGAPQNIMISGVGVRP